MTDKKSLFSTIKRLILFVIVQAALNRDKKKR